MQKTACFVLVGAFLAVLFVVPFALAGDPKVHYAPARGISNPDGAAVYAAYCASCHGEDGRGSAQARDVLGREIPDLTTIADRHGEFDRRCVMSSIARAGTSAEEGVTMPCWCKILRGMDRDPRTRLLIVRNLARHLESLQQVASH